MAYNCPRDLDGFMPHLPKADTKFRQQLGTDLLAFLAEPENEITCQDIGQFIDNLIPWMQSSNFKVSGCGIEIMTHLVDRLGYDFRPYLQTVLPCVIDRLGDARDTVREKSQLLILKLLEREVISPQHLLDKLIPCFSHKNAKIREEVLGCLINTLNEHGTNAVALSKLTPLILKLVCDPTASVRDTAVTTIVEVYKHVGERLRQDIQRRNLIPATKLPALLAKFDEARAAGELLPSASLDVCPDEVDRIAMPKPIVPVKKAGLGTTMKRVPSSVSRGGSATPQNAAPVFTRVGSLRKSNTQPSGGVDEDTFTKSFEDVPVIQLFTPREVGEHMKSIHDIISDTNKEWNKRVDALKKIRSLVVAGATNYEDFHTSLRNMELHLQTSLKDLRSQVVREACITLAYISQTMGLKFDKTAELLLPNMINLIQNSAKVIASAGIVCIKFLITYTQSPRLVPILTSHLANSKSKEIRRSCCEFLDIIMNQWGTHPLEKHIAVLQEALKRGISDADPEARVSSRKAYKGFREHFPEQAEVLLLSLEPSYRKALQGELSSSSSSGSLAQSGGGAGAASSVSYRAPPRQYSAVTPTSRAAPAPTLSATASTENLSTCSLQRTPSLPRSSSRQRSGIPVLSSASGKKGFRSNSAIDLQAAQRARVRAQYSVMARQKISSGTASLQGEVAQQARPRKSSDSAPPNVVASPERVSRTRSRNSGVSHSQPTSRSGSPSSSKYHYLYRNHNLNDVIVGTGDNTATPPPPTGARPRRLSSGIPRSTQGSRDTSRETSPNRSGTSGISGGGRYRRGVMMSGAERPPLSPATRQQPVMAQRILQQSREAESALADALTYDQLDSSCEYQRSINSPRKTMRSMDNHSDDSETSSVCSERSFDSYRRDSYSWSGSQQRLASRDMWEPCRDINEIIALCASTTWQERKDGLVSLRYYLNTGKQLSPGELKHITEIFTRMFMDSHTKGLCVFLDTLNEIIKRYKSELHDWLYVLLQRIFHKLGMDLLSSTHSKLLNTLDIVRVSFPVAAQMACVYRFLIDAAQTPNSKVKVAVLNYLAGLCNGGVGTPGGVVSITGNATVLVAHDAILRIINYTQDPKSSAEIKNAAKTCVVALWNYNTPQMTMLLAELPRDQQDTAAHIVHSHLRKSSTGSETPGSPSSTSTVTSPKGPLHMPQSPTGNGSVAAGGMAVVAPRTVDDMNQEEIYRSLRRTTAEIQNYSYETLGTKLDRDRDTTSQDSGISQMSVGNEINRHDVALLEDRMEELHIRTNYAARNAATGPRSLPFSVNGVAETDENGDHYLDELSEEDLVQKILTICVVDNPARLSEKRKLLAQLTKVIKQGNLEPVTQNFKKLLRIMLDNLNMKDDQTQVVVLKLLTEIFKNPDMKECWCKFIELLTIRVFNAHCDENRNVVKVAEETAQAMSVFPFNTVLNALSPLIQTGTHLAIQGAIKMLTKLIEMNPNEVTDDHLASIMPGLIKANDHDESSVRKCGVFCMVALHRAVGEDRLSPYIESLAGSKLKLLRLYISRATSSPSGGATTNHHSVPTSPRNSGATPTNNSS